MKNKFLLTVSQLSWVVILGMQNVQAMDPKEIEDGFYTIKCQQFSNKKKPEDPEGLLHVIEQSRHWGDVLHNTEHKDNYLKDANQRKEVIWHVQKAQDENVSNAYTLKSLAHTHSSHVNAGLLRNSMDQIAYCRADAGCVPTIVKDNDSDINSYLPGSESKRNQVLWNITSAEDGTYKIRSLSHSQSDTDDCNEGCLAAADNSRSNQGLFSEVLRSYNGSNYYKEFYFVNKENGQLGRSRKRILWNFLPVLPEEMNQLLPQQLSTVDIKIQANAIQSVQVSK